MPFKKGEGGRAKGVLNKVTTEARAAAKALVDDPVYRAKLAEHLRKLEVAPAIEVLLWHYAKGKPTDIIECRGRWVNSMGRCNSSPRRSCNGCFETTSV